MNKIFLFFIISISTLLSDLIHPPNDSELSYIHVTFKWDIVHGASAYEFELSNSNNFSVFTRSDSISFLE